MDSSCAGDFRAAIASLSDAEYENLIKRLGLFAIGLVRSYRLVWQGVRGGRLPKGLEPEDIVGLAIERALNKNGRKWNQTKYPTIEKFLRSVIRSIVNHYADCPENRLTDALGLNSETDEDSVNPEDQIQCSKPTPRECVQSSEFMQKFREGLDDELQFLVLLFEEGLTKRAEIAAEFGKMPQEVDNLMKKLKRRLEEFLTRESLEVKGGRK